MEAEMTQHPTKQNGYLWSTTQISLASYFGGPVAGCYFLGRNYKESGRPDYSKKCYAIGIVGTILLFTILFLIPEEVMTGVPGMLLPIAYSSIITGFAVSYQKKLIEERLKEGYKRNSKSWCFLVIMSLVVIQIPLLFLSGFLFAAIS